MATPPVGGTQGQQQGNQVKGDALRGLDLRGFLDLMIAELQNQDPMNPMDNSEMLQQISQIRSIDSTDKLTTTLDSVMLGQSISSASALIGKQVEALSDDAKEVTGKVDSVAIEDGVAKLRIGDAKVGLKNLRRILPAA
jgi:flagellar basal-body rod modification protein FlgD